VLVKTSYFPNWRVSGDEGTYRSTPNFMVVVPTQKHVTLHYARTKAEWLGLWLTGVGLIGLAALVVWGRRRAAARASVSRAEDRPGPDTIGPPPGHSSLLPSAGTTALPPPLDRR